MTSHGAGREQGREHPCFSTEWGHDLERPCGSRGVRSSGSASAPWVAELRGVRSTRAQSSSVP